MAMVIRGQHSVLTIGSHDSSQTICTDLPVVGESNFGVMTQMTTSINVGVFTIDHLGRNPRTEFCIVKDVEHTPARPDAFPYPNVGLLKHSEKIGWRNIRIAGIDNSITELDMIL